VVEDLLVWGSTNIAGPSGPKTSVANKQGLRGTTTFNAEHSTFDAQWDLRSSWLKDEADAPALCRASEFSQRENCHRKAMQFHKARDERDGKDKRDSELRVIALRWSLRILLVLGSTNIIGPSGPGV